MEERVFVDTNILIYAYDLDAGEKHLACSQKIRELWENGLGIISTQVMQEFYVNITQKIPKPLSLSKARKIIQQYEAWEVRLIDPSSIIFATEIQERNLLSFWDSLIIASACQAGVKVLLSEDLNAGQNIEGIRVVNPLFSLH